MYYDNSHYCGECTGLGCVKCNGTGVERFPICFKINNATPPAIARVSGVVTYYGVIVTSYRPVGAAQPLISRKATQVNRQFNYAGYGQA